MASRRSISSVSRRFMRLLFLDAAIECSNAPTIHPLSCFSIPALKNLQFILFPVLQRNPTLGYGSVRHFCSRVSNSSGEDEQDDAEETDGGDEQEVIETEGDSFLKHSFRRRKTEVEKTLEAAEIGYRVVGPLDSYENPFKPYEPIFAVVQVGSHQFKVSNGDSIFTERLKFCQVNDKLILNRVLMVGSRFQTIIGRPTLPDAVVHAVVEEHALDAKVIIFKKKRRKNYRRTKGHRQELTKLRITDIQGIEKSDINVAVAA